MVSQVPEKVPPQVEMSKVPTQGSATQPIKQESPITMNLPALESLEALQAKAKKISFQVVIQQMEKGVQDFKEARLEQTFRKSRGGFIGWLGNGLRFLHGCLMRRYKLEKDFMANVLSRKQELEKTPLGLRQLEYAKEHQ